MIIAIIAAAAIWLLFGKKALAWMIVISAVVFALAVFFAPPIKLAHGWDCKDDYTAVPMKICPSVQEAK